jgi:hypothetical protein
MATPWLTVLHHPRRPDYLQQTLKDLERAGARWLANTGQLILQIVVDGNPDDVSAPPGWGKISIGNGEQGIRRALQNVLKAAVEAQADHLLYFEDDVVGCKNAVLALQQIPVHPLTGFLVACNNTRGLTAVKHHPYLSLVEADGVLCPKGFWGSQALKIAGRALQHLAKIKIPPFEQPNSGDVWLGQHAATQAAPWKRFGVLSPSLFQHVGFQSLAWPGRPLDPLENRAADDFDPEFDALMIADLYRNNKVF